MWNVVQKVSDTHEPATTRLLQLRDALPQIWTNISQNMTDNLLCLIVFKLLWKLEVAHKIYSDLLSCKGVKKLGDDQKKLSIVSDILVVLV